MRTKILHITIFLLALQCTGLQPLLKFPMLVIHFREHVRQEKNIGLVDFLLIHYSNDSSHHDSRHAQLPFKKADNSNFFVIALPDGAADELDFPDSAASHTICTDDHVSSGALKSLFKPPRLG